VNLKDCGHSYLQVPYDVTMKEPSTGIVKLMLDHRGFLALQQDGVTCEGIHQIQIARLAKDMEGLPMHVKRMPHPCRIRHDKSNHLTLLYPDRFDFRVSLTVNAPLVWIHGATQYERNFTVDNTPQVDRRFVS